MVMEIKGQPGLSGTRWAATSFTGPMFNAPFGSHRKRSGFGALPLAVDFASKTRADQVTQSDVAEGQVPGVTITAYFPLKSEAIPQPTLDTVFRTAFAQLGYDVSASAIDLTTVAYQWKFDPAAKVWEALPVAGPPVWVRRSPAVAQTTATSPTAKDLENAPKAVETYKVLLRAKDLTISPAKVDALLSAARTAARDKGWSNALWGVDVHGVEPPPEAPKSLVASIGPWIALVGVGWIATLAMRGKVSK